MEGIEISFPLSVCRDILEDSVSLQWRFYEASISPGKVGKKTLGSLRARVANTEGDQFVDLVLAFPRNFIKCPAVRGKLRCRAELVQSETDQPDASVSETLKTRLQRESETSERVAADQKGFGAKTKGLDGSKALGSVRGSVRTAAHVKQVQDAPCTEDASNRPCRRREKPSKYKDYVPTFDLASKQTSSEQTTLDVKTENTELSNEEASVNSNALSQSASPANSNRDSDDGGIAKDINQTKKKMHQATPLAAQSPSPWPTKQKKRVVRKYDKLIKNLQQASAQSGLELLSVITGYRSEVESEVGDTPVSTTRLPESDDNNIHTEQNLTHEKAECPQGQETGTAIGGASKSSRGALQDCHGRGEEGSDQNESCTVTPVPCSTNGTKTTVQRTASATVPDKATSGTTAVLDMQSSAVVPGAKKGVKTLKKPIPNPSPHLTSFPRKFPSSLTRIDVLDVSLTKASVADSRKRPSTSAEAVREILSKYKKLQPVERMELEEREEEYFDDDRDVDYLPGKDSDSDSDADLDVYESDSEDESQEK